MRILRRSCCLRYSIKLKKVPKQKAKTAMGRMNFSLSSCFLLWRLVTWIYQRIQHFNITIKLLAFLYFGVILIHFRIKLSNHTIIRVCISGLLIRCQLGTHTCELTVYYFCLAGNFTYFSYAFSNPAFSYNNTSALRSKILCVILSNSDEISLYSTPKIECISFRAPRSRRLRTF